MGNPKLVEVYDPYFTARSQSSIPQTLLFQPIVPGLFRLSYYVNAFDASGTGTFDIVFSWTDSVSSQSSTIALNPSGITEGSLVLFNVTEQPISFEINVSGFSTAPFFIPIIAAERVTGEF